jgi:lysophospholipase L1-like esterase
MRRRSWLHSRLTVLGIGVASLHVACSASSLHRAHSNDAKPSNGATGTGDTTGNAEPLFNGNVGTTSTGAGAAVHCTGTTPEEGFVDIPVSDPGIRYVGRVVETADSVTFAFSAVQIQTVFNGDAIDMKLNDYGTHSATTTNYYWVILDGNARKLETCSARRAYSLARNLSAGPHTLAIVKRTESAPGGKFNTGKGEFLGFRVHPGTTLSAPRKPTRLMEFVGDSITCGYGNEVSTKNPGALRFTAANEDAYHAYGAVTARAFDADYVAVAVSGRGLTRNYSGSAGDLVPTIYETSLPDVSTAPPWNHGNYTPDVIVVNVGTNDFSPGIALNELDAFRATFRKRYIDFLTRIRVVHSSASIVAVVGPMMGDSYPAGYNALTSITSDIQAAVEARHTANDNDVYFFAFAPQTSPYGEDWHPTIATHQKMAAALQPFVANIRGW